MSFRIFASGTGGFHFSKDDNIDSSDFDTVKLLAAFQFTSPTAKDVGGTVAGMVTPSADITDAAAAYAVIQLGGLLCLAVDSLAMCAGKEAGWIAVSGRTTHPLWPDTVSAMQYKFFPGDSPGAEFLRAVTPSLKETSLNTLGVLNALVLVLGKFSNVIDPSATPIINIQITH